jgi:DNA-binding transcriptional ArsR family regulator
MPTRPGAYPGADLQARLLVAAAEPSRLLILRCLRGGPRTVGEIAAATGLAVTNASPHLAVLRHAGLVLHRKQGRYVRYQLDPESHRPAAGTGGPDYLDLAGLRLELPG